MTEVNMLGQYEFSNLPEGEYDLLIASKATWRHQVKWDSSVDYAKKWPQTKDIYKKGEYINFYFLKKNILTPHFDESDYEAALDFLGVAFNKYHIENFKLDSGDLKEVNQDFGTAL